MKYTKKMILESADTPNNFESKHNSFVNMVRSTIEKAILSELLDKVFSTSQNLSIFLSRVRYINEFNKEVKKVRLFDYKMENGGIIPLETVYLYASSDDSSGDYVDTIVVESLINLNKNEDKPNLLFNIAFKLGHKYGPDSELLNHKADYINKNLSSSNISFNELVLTIENFNKIMNIGMPDLLANLN